MNPQGTKGQGKAKCRNFVSGSCFHKGMYMYLLVILFTQPEFIL